MEVRRGTEEGFIKPSYDIGLPIQAFETSTCDDKMTARDTNLLTVRSILDCL